MLPFRSQLTTRKIKNQAMKPIQTTLKFITATALAVVIVGCASGFQDKKDIAIAAGFKVITPVKPDQVALLPTLPKETVTQITYQGKTYYILPDVKNNQAYVGGPAEYQSYQKLSLQKQISDANLQAAQMNQMAAMNQMNWGAWGGWGGIGGYRRMGPYGLY